MTGKELLKLLKQNGWELNRISGSHHVMKKGQKLVSVPIHSTKELGSGLLHKLLKDADIKLG